MSTPAPHLKRASAAGGGGGVADASEAAATSAPASKRARPAVPGDLAADCASIRFLPTPRGLGNETGKPDALVFAMTYRPLTPGAEPGRRTLVIPMNAVVSLDLVESETVNAVATVVMSDGAFLRWSAGTPSRAWFQQLTAQVLNVPGVATMSDAEWRAWATTNVEDEAPRRA